MPQSAIAAARPSLHILRAAEWASIPHLVHGFAELNLSFRVGDDPEAVQENWRRVSDAAGAGLRFLTMTQVHGADVVTVHPGTRAAGECDGVVTAAPGIALGVLTADCVPILIVAPAQRVVAAVHAGWRGTVAGIAACVVERLHREFGVHPGDLRVAFGPAIGGCCYEVDAEIAEDLEGRWGPLPAAIHRPTGSRPRLDLRAANAGILRRTGVRPDEIVSVGPCTKCAVTGYFSHRAATGTDGGPTGRQLSFIGWRK